MHGNSRASRRRELKAFEIADEYGSGPKLDFKVWKNEK